VLGHKYKFAHERTPLRLPSKVTDMYTQLYMYSAVFSLANNQYDMLEWTNIINHQGLISNNDQDDDDAPPFTFSKVSALVHSL
jgi:hypothetical protein